MIGKYWEENSIFPGRKDQVAEWICLLKPSDVVDPAERSMPANDIPYRVTSFEICLKWIDGNTWNLWTSGTHWGNISCNQAKTRIIYDRWMKTNELNVIMGLSTNWHLWDSNSKLSGGYDDKPLGCPISAQILKIILHEALPNVHDYVKPKNCWLHPHQRYIRYHQ